jgi:hypothetical protein
MLREHVHQRRLFPRLFFQRQIQVPKYKSGRWKGHIMHANATFNSIFCLFVFPTFPLEQFNFHVLEGGGTCMMHHALYFFCELHNTSETLTTHTHSSL